MFNNTSPTEIYTLSLHDALPIYNNDTERWRRRHIGCVRQAQNRKGQYRNSQNQVQARDQNILNLQEQILALQNNPDRKSTRLNSSHSQISYAVFCLKKEKK